MFLNTLYSKFSNLSNDDIEDIYHDTFLAVQDNIKNGRVREQTSWTSYIITIGEHIASKKLRRKIKNLSIDDGEDATNVTLITKIEGILKDLNKPTMYNDRDVLSVLGEELQFIQEKCSTIIRLFYYDDWSMERISEAVGMKNATTVKSKKNQCMNSLTSRVKKSLRSMGIID